MALYLVQHGKSFSKNQDAEQGLTNEGIAQVQLIAGVAKGYSIKVDCIYHSVKKRARQTAEFFSQALQNNTNIKEITGIKPMDDVTILASSLQTEDNIMYVGHLPFMEKLTSYLVAGSADLRVFKFQNGGIVCLDQEEGDSSWFIKWALMPEI